MRDFEAVLPLAEFGVDELCQSSVPLRTRFSQAAGKTVKYGSAAVFCPELVNSPNPLRRGGGLGRDLQV